MRSTTSLHHLADADRLGRHAAAVPASMPVMSSTSLMSDSRCRPALRMWSAFSRCVGRRRFELHELAEPENRVERRAQLVAHARQELALRAARRFGRLTRGAQRFFGPAPFGDVANDARRADDRAVGVARCARMHFHPTRSAGLRQISHFVAAVVRRAVGERPAALVATRRDRRGWTDSAATWPSSPRRVKPVICRPRRIEECPTPRGIRPEITSSISLTTER